jgi:transcriptional regulator with XRE-family HTH domain
LGMSYSALAHRSGVPQSTVKRILRGSVAKHPHDTIAAIAAALGLSINLAEQTPDEFCRAQARRKAEYIAHLVQGTSALEGMAVDRQTYQRLIEASYQELLAGSRRRLWAP